MPRLLRLATAALLLAPATVPAWAQPAANSSAATTPATTPPVAPTAGPHLQVATVRQQGGWSAKKLIGGDVYNDQKQKIGEIEDLILSQQNTVQLAIVTVGGFLGIGAKLVAVPFDKLEVQRTKEITGTVWPGATKQVLQAMPNFTYGH